LQQIGETGWTARKIAELRARERIEAAKLDAKLENLTPDQRRALDRINHSRTQITLQEQSGLISPQVAENMRRQLDMRRAAIINTGIQPVFSTRNPLKVTEQEAREGYVRHPDNPNLWLNKTYRNGMWTLTAEWDPAYVESLKSRYQSSKPLVEPDAAILLNERGEPEFRPEIYAQMNDAAMTAVQTSRIKRDLMEQANENIKQMAEKIQEIRNTGDKIALRKSLNNAYAWLGDEGFDDLIEYLRGAKILGRSAIEDLIAEEEPPGSVYEEVVKPPEPVRGVDYVDYSREAVKPQESTERESDTESEKLQRWLARLVGLQQMGMY
ncbi:MAG: hypothetical protein DRJ03_29890, partial [Chloroflexi bacterium]